MGLGRKCGFWVRRRSLIFGLAYCGARQLAQSPWVGKQTADLSVVRQLGRVPLAPVLALPGPNDFGAPA